MSKITTTPFTQSIRNEFLVLASGNGNTSTLPGLNPSNVSLLLTAGNDGSVVKNISIASNDSVNRDLMFFLSKDGGTTDYLLATIRVSPSGGFDGATNNNELFNFIGPLPFDNSGRRALVLNSGQQVYVGVQSSSISSGKSVYITTQIENF